MSFQVRKLLRGDDVHKTTAFQIESSKTFNSDETVVSFIDEFENATENLDPTISAQLNRLQRNLKGLPPLIEETPAPTTPASTGVIAIDESKQTGKKIVFD